MRHRASERLGWILVVGLAAAPAMALARADEERLAFAIPGGSFKAAATAFALQAKVSIDLSAAGACGASQGFIGKATPEAAIRALASDAGCAARRTDARAYQIIPRAPKSQGVPAIASASEPETPPPLLSELVVVATRRPALADRLAYSVSVLDERAAASRGVRDTTDLALTVPSMTVTNLGPGRDKVILRGLSDGPLTGQTQSMVGIYLDDVRLTYNAPDPDLLLVDMAQVEVLRGPQGALYGAGSLGGVLQLTSRRPDPDRFDAWVSASASAMKGGETGGASSAMLNGPLFGGRAAARVVGYVEKSGGYIDDPQRGRSNVNGAWRSGLRLSTTLQLRPRWDIDAGVVTQAIETDDTQYAQRAVGAFARRNRLAEPHDNDFLQAHVGVGGAFGGRQAKLTLAVVRHDISSRYDASTAPPVSVPLAPDAAVAFDDDNHVGAVMAEAAIAARPEQRVQWQAGAFLARTRQGRDGLLVSPDVAPTILARENRRDVLGEAALFGEAVGPLGGGWSLTLGGRLFATRSEVSSRAVSGAISGAFRDQQGYVGFAPKVVVSYAPSVGTLIYAQASEGYRAGGFNTAILPGQTFDAVGGQPQRRYAGDELWSFEVGAKATLLDGRLRLRAAGFQARWKSIQSDQLLPSGLPYTANLGDGVNLGVEFEGGYVDGGLRLDASVLLNNPELETVNAAFPGRQDFGLAGAPKVTASMAASYDGRLSKSWG